MRSANAPLNLSRFYFSLLYFTLLRNHALLTLSQKSQKSEKALLGFNWAENRDWEERMKKLYFLTLSPGNCVSGSNNSPTRQKLYTATNSTYF